MKCFARLLMLYFCFAVSAFPQDLPTAAPEKVGLSSERLQRVENVIKQYIEKKQIAGAVALVARKGKVAYFKSAGMQDLEAKTPMQTNTIFRIASMTKPVTSVAVMMLYEEGRFLLNDPVHKYLPEFKNMMVLNPERATNGQAGDSLVPAKRPITIRHLLTHTSGLAYHWNEKIGASYKNTGVAHGMSLHNETLAENMKRLAKQPLLFHPGEKYEYSLSVDVLGYLVEVVSGKSLADFLQERIFTPLKMPDTHFFLPAHKTARLAVLYRYSAEKGMSRVPEAITTEGNLEFSPAYPYGGPQKFYSGGAGLCATIADYARFAQMLLNGGELDGVRLLSRKSVELMTADFVGELSPAGGFGLGFGVRRTWRESGELGSIGTYGWSGAWNTRFWVDPQEQMVMLVFTQLYPFGVVDIMSKFSVATYQAIID